MAITHYRPDGGVNGWVRSSFMLPDGKVTDTELRLRSAPDGAFKFADTTIGGNQAINPPPQFTHLCDLNEVRIADKPGHQYDFLSAGRSMGRYYSDTIDTPSVHAHFRFGVPVFNTMTSFFGNFYNSSASNLARTGRGDGIAFTIGRIAGTVATLPIQPYILLGRMIKFLLDMPSTKYCYLKPTMAVYHMATAGILNNIAADSGFVLGQSNNERDFSVDGGGLPSFEDGYMNKLLPDVYRSNGSIDTFKIFTRYQRLANRRYDALRKAHDVSGTPREVMDAIGRVYRSPNYNGQGKDTSVFKNMDQYLNSYFGTNLGSDDVPKNSSEPIGDQNEDDIMKNYSSETTESVLGQGDEPDAGLFDFLQAELNDGGQFITFRIEDPGSNSESFSNSVKESAIAEKMNSLSSSSRGTRFSFMDGQVADLGGLGTLIGMVTSTVGDLMRGIGESIGVSGLGQIFGNAMVDIPKYWDGSTAELPKTTFTMSLQAWSGDDLTRYQSLMVPLAMVLAAALPRSTGYQSYTSPFLLEYYCKGRSSTRFGIIDSLQITRGTGNVGFTEDGKPLAIDITFTVADLSSVMHMPMTSAFSPTQLLSSSGLSKLLFADTSAFTDYMATISSVGLVDQIYTTKRLKRNFHKATLAFQDWTSPAHWASVASNGTALFGIQPGRFGTIFTNVTERG